MELVLATLTLGVGGSESYLVTVAEQFERLGHQVTLYTRRPGDMAEVAEERGLRVATRPGELPAECEAILVQDAAMAYELAERYPDAPQLFRAASEVHDLQLPPQLPGIVGVAVALNEPVAERLSALALAPKVVRLRQPVDTERFAPLESIGQRPMRALLLGNYLRGTRRRLLTKAFAEAGVECTVAGVPGEITREPERAIAEADIVVGKGRAALEGMSAGRATYVYDLVGSDGWVTRDSYPRLEADNFAGRTDGEPVSAERIRRDLQLYSPNMGVVNRDLAIAHHGARRHTEQLVGLLRDLQLPSEREPAPLAELSRLVRRQWAAEGRAIEQLRRAQVLQEQVAELEGELERLTSTRRWRFAARLGGLLDRLRGRT